MLYNRTEKKGYRASHFLPPLVIVPGEHYLFLVAPLCEKHIGCREGNGDPWDHFLGRCSAVASKYTFCGHSVQSCAFASQFKRSCAPHCVFHCASDCGTFRSLLAVSIYLIFEPRSIIFSHRKLACVNLIMKRYKAVEIFVTLLMGVF